jgi:fused signal recognition particle receptor
MRAYEESEASEGRTPRTSVAPGAPSSVVAAPGAVAPGGLGARIRGLFQREATDETWRAFEDVLIRADVGPKAAADLVARVRADYRPGMDAGALLRTEVIAVLGPDRPLALATERLAVVLVVGVNGSGKTTTIGKLAARLTEEGRTVSLAASDTFRAAAGEQLEVWAGRAGAHLVSQGRGADPGAVAFDAVTSAIARGSDVLIVDTAGRLHTKTNLMAELTKVKRVIGRQLPGAPHETLLVLDATTGQNGIAQARLFHEAIGLTGLVLTKLDGTAKGGVAVAVADRYRIPIVFTAFGEDLESLAPFDPDAYVEWLLAA